MIEVLTLPTVLPANSLHASTLLAFDKPTAKILDLELGTLWERLVGIMRRVRTVESDK